MSIIQKWLAGLIGLGALYLVVAPDSHVLQAGQAAQKFKIGRAHV